MIRHYFRLLILILLLPDAVFAQKIDIGPGYQYMMIHNPSLAGSEGDGALRLSYLNLYPGNNYNLHSVYLSYDSYFPDLHGGAEFYLVNDYLGGIMNDIYGGVSYAYNLQAGEDLFINAGLSASVYHRGFNFDKAVLPDQIDPLGGISAPSSEVLTNDGRTLFDVGTGMVFISGRYFGGLSVLHLTQPDIGRSESSDSKLKRKYFFHLVADYELNRIYHINLRPLLSLELQGKYVSAGAGAVVETRHISASSVFLLNNYGNFDIQAGFSVKREQLTIFYNYRFNVKSENSLLPFTLAHQAGLAFSLNNVEKRIKIKTINVPLL